MIKDPSYKVGLKDGALYICTYREPINLAQARELEGISIKVECSVITGVSQKLSHLNEGEHS